MAPGRSHASSPEARDRLSIQMFMYDLLQCFQKSDIFIRHSYGDANTVFAAGFIAPVPDDDPPLRQQPVDPFSIPDPEEDKVGVSGVDLIHRGCLAQLLNQVVTLFDDLVDVISDQIHMAKRFKRRFSRQIVEFVVELDLGQIADHGGAGNGDTEADAGQAKRLGESLKNDKVWILLNHG